MCSGNILCVFARPGRSQLSLLMTVIAEVMVGGEFGGGSGGGVGAWYRNPGDVVCNVFALTFD